ncbi:hypothetical protein HBH67_194730 [Parastagonospora nodorum]|nr:hypothetical protein HBH67_194730 [Parastagonospora nodorum]
MLLCRTIKLLSIPSADKYSKKHLKVREADALKQVDANVREEENKNCSSLYYSNKREAKLDSLLDSDDYCLDSSLDINSKDNLENKEATTAKDLLTTVHPANKQTRIRDSLSARVETAIEHCTLEEIFASVIGITRTQAINEVVAIDSANSTLCDLSDPLVVRFCIFSNPALENIGILTNKKVVEMQTNTATALANKLAAVNKLTIAEANMPTVHPKATKHRLALLVAQFALVRSFRKVDRHVFRADNTISGRTVFNKFYNCKLESTIIAKFYKDL